MGSDWPCLSCPLSPACRSSSLNLPVFSHPPRSQTLYTCSSFPGAQCLLTECKVFEQNQLPVLEFNMRYFLPHALCVLLRCYNSPPALALTPAFLLSPVKCPLPVSVATCEPDSISNSMGSVFLTCWEALRVHPGPLVVTCCCSLCPLLPFPLGPLGRARPHQLPPAPRSQASSVSQTYYYAGLLPGHRAQIRFLLRPTRLALVL